MAELALCAGVDGSTIFECEKFVKRTTPPSIYLPVRDRRSAEKRARGVGIVNQDAMAAWTQHIIDNPQETASMQAETIPNRAA